MKFTNARESSSANGVKTGVYGPSGSGKTTLIATAPRPLIISGEKGLLSIKRYDTPAIECDGYGDLWDSLRWLENSNEASGFDTISVDSVTHFAYDAIRHLKRTNKDPRKAYFALQEDLEELIARFVALKQKHILMLFKQGTVETVEGAKYGCAMPSKNLANGMPYNFDEWWHLAVKTDPTTSASERFVRCISDFAYDAKDRSGVLMELENVQIDPEANDIQQCGLGRIYNQIMNS